MALTENEAHMNILKRLRMDKGMSIENLSQLSKVAPNTISNLERRNKNAIPRTIMRLAKALDVDYEVLQPLENQVIDPNLIAA